MTPFKSLCIAILFFCFTSELSAQDRTIKGTLKGFRVYDYWYVDIETNGKTMQLYCMVPECAAWERHENELKGRVVEAKVRTRKFFFKELKTTKEIQEVVGLELDQREIQKRLEPWGRETPENAKAFFSQYEHILKVRVNRDHWISKKAPQLSIHHFEGTVVKVYKGNWQASQEITFLTSSDGPAPKNPTESKNSFVIVLTNKKTNSEISLDNGDVIPFREDLEPGLTYFYPGK